MITVLVVESVQEAELIASRLRAENIQVFIRDKHINQIYAGSLQAFGGIRIKVPDHQAIDAVTVLEQMGYNPLDQKESINPLLGFIKEKTDLIWGLNALSWQKRKAILFFLMLFLFLAFAILIVLKSY
jgi:hypothetical protein